MKVIVGLSSQSVLLTVIGGRDCIARVFQENQEIGALCSSARGGWATLFFSGRVWLSTFLQFIAPAKYEGFQI